MTAPVWGDGPLSGLPQPAQSNGAAPARTAPSALTPTDIIARWRDEGPLVRIATGIAPLDELSRGGFPFPWRVMIVGAPSAGKTFVYTCIADSMARRLAEKGIAVGILAVDEEPDDLVVRFAQIAGFTVAQAELRAPETLDAIAEALRLLPIRFYDSSHTIESAAADTAAWAAARDMRAALFVDSIQTASSAAALGKKAETERAIVATNISAIRGASTTHRLLVVGTSEANRQSYRSQAAAEESNDLAAGAESRTIEYGAQTQLMLRTPKNHPDVCHVRVAKNRRAHVGEFWLRLDRDRHSVEECDNPEAGAARSGETRDERVRAAKRSAVERDARELIALVRDRPAIGTRALRDAWKAAGLGGVEVLGAARELLMQGVDGWRLVDRGEGKPGKPQAWHVERVPTAIEGADE
jgi:KaiC/GvpD/RAD55 family RecA-like ATPase